jgi:cysteinyl-tRNA synthetase
MIKNILLSLILFSLFACSDTNEPAKSEPTSAVLNGVTVKYFMYQIQNLETKANIDLLAATNYDMLVVEPGFNFTEDPYDVQYLVSKLKTKPDGSRRILLAYIDIGQAEDYRSYWGNDWKAPTADKRGYPDFMITIDPDGWEGNYPVAFWDTAWKNIWLGKDALIEKIAQYGFDGVYLDWVEAYDDEKVAAVADAEGVNAPDEMIKFVSEIRRTGKAINSAFLVIPQNAAYLLNINSAAYSAVIDGIAVEDTWFYGRADAAWNSSNAGDLSGGERHADDYSTANRIKQNKKFLNLGLPVFTVDYCVKKSNADYVYQASRENGFIPLVTRVSLSHITETPPF